MFSVEFRENMAPPEMSAWLDQNIEPRVVTLDEKAAIAPPETEERQLMKVTPGKVISLWYSVHP
jgi:hypothetical protein